MEQYVGLDVSLKALAELAPGLNKSILKRLGVLKAFRDVARYRHS
jgi:hypothetical protein